MVREKEEEVELVLLRINIKPELNLLRVRVGSVQLLPVR